MIETGRYVKTDRSERLCTSCNRNEIEDEYHFILICPSYKEIRNKYVCEYYWKAPSMWKLVQLLNSHDLNALKSLGKFLYFATSKRNKMPR